MHTRQIQIRFNYEVRLTFSESYDSSRQATLNAAYVVNVEGICEQQIPSFIQMKSMGQSFSPRNQHVKSQKEIQRDLHEAAIRFMRYADHKILFIYSAGKKAVPEAYEAYYGCENFMHLVGYKIRDDISRHVTARDFYQICVDGSGDVFAEYKPYFVFTNNRKETSAKIDALLSLLDYRHVKLYKIGPKRAATVKNEFDVGIGTAREILGFSKRKFPFPIPVTAMQRPLGDYVFEQKNVIAVLLKKKDADYYSEVVGCISGGIVRDSLPDSIKSRISAELTTIACRRIEGIERIEKNRKE